MSSPRRGLIVSCLCALPMLFASSYAMPPFNDAIVVEVDCDQGADLAAVLTRLDSRNPRSVRRAGADRDYILEVRGTCSGNFVIPVDNVTLRGEEPATSRLVGENVPGTTIPFGPVVTVRGAESVALENLSISGGSRGLSALVGARVDVRDCEIHGNLGEGILAQESHLQVFDTTVTDNNGHGIRAWNVPYALVRDSTIQANAGFGVFAENTGRLEVLGDTLVQSNTQGGLLAGTNSVVLITDGVRVVDHLRNTLQIQDQSAMWVSGFNPGVELIADETDQVMDFNIWWQSNLQVYGTSLGTGALLRGDMSVNASSAVFFYGGTHDGSILTNDFSDLQVGFATVTGPIDCQRGSDAVCWGPNVNTGPVTGCPTQASACVSPSTSGAAVPQPAVRAPTPLYPIGLKRPLRGEIPGGRAHGAAERR